MIAVKMAAPAAAAAGELGVRRFESQLKIQQLESDTLRMRLIDAESSSDRRTHALQQGIDHAVGKGFLYIWFYHIPGQLSLAIPSWIGAMSANTKLGRKQAHRT